MEALSTSRDKELENIKESLQQLAKSKKPNCRFGISCRRLFCKFNHGFIFTKDNRILNLEKPAKNACLNCKFEETHAYKS